MDGASSHVERIEEGFVVARVVLNAISPLPFRVMLFLPGCYQHAPFRVLLFLPGGWVCVLCAGQGHGSYGLRQPVIQVGPR
jgi:hypothetical protein